MIPQIKELNFPSYATLSTATATLVDMGERTISTQVKIDGSTVPDFSYDWEVEFQGERYIQPVRKPQAGKGNESICATIDLTFYHWATYQLKRFFFAQIEVLKSGTLMANNYVYPISYTLPDLIIALQRNLDYYLGKSSNGDFNEDFNADFAVGTQQASIRILLNDNPEVPYSEDKVEWSFNYTHIWDVITQIYEKYGVRWYWDYDADTGVYTIMIGFSAVDVSHVFEYGYKNGLTKIERQIQDSEIRNQMFGRGGSQNLPYRYFKNVDPNNTSWKADPDWIPELASIYFSELRGKSFRDYVRGWKAKHYGGQAYLPATDAYTKGYTDETFDPIEYVEDADSIAEYGIIQGGLDNNEEIFPTIQKRVIEGLGRADEVVDVETILVDEPTSNTKLASEVLEIKDSNNDIISSVNQPRTLEFVSNSYEVPLGRKGYFVKDFNISAVENVATTDKYSRFTTDGIVEVFETRKGNVSHPLTLQVSWVKIINADTSEEIQDIVNIESRTRFYIHAEVVVSNFFEEQEKEVQNYPMYGQNATLVRTPYEQCSVVVTLDNQMELSEFLGEIIGNYTEGVNRISGSVTIPANGSGRVELETQKFTIAEGGATNVDIPIRIKSTDTSGSYTEQKIINAVNAETNEVLDPLNLTEGTYFLRVVTDITNLTEQSQDYTVELLPAYIYYPYDASSWRPTFDIWIKDIWESARLDNENDTSYAERVWRPILGDRQGNEAKVVFSSGSLSGYSDWEFPIVAFAFDDSKSLEGVPSHWRLTLAKSDAEVDATGKWIPSIQTQAHAGDHFYFIGIDMPHQYVLWAEEEVDKWKRENMPSNLTPIWVVGLDKVRINTIEGNEMATLLSQIEVGSIMSFKDKRFTDDIEKRNVQSLTITWNDGRILPETEVVLSDKPISTRTLKTDLKESLYNLSNGLVSLADTVKDRNSTIKDIKRKQTELVIKTNNNSNDISSVYDWIRVTLEDIAEIRASVQLPETNYASVSDLKNTLATLDREWEYYSAIYESSYDASYKSRIREYGVAWNGYRPLLLYTINSATSKVVSLSDEFIEARDAFNEKRDALKQYEIDNNIN